MSTTEVVKREQELARREEPQNMLAVVMRACQDPTVDPARLREFLQIGRELEADRAKREYVAAFIAAKLEMDGIKIRKDGRITYADKPGKSGGVIKFMRYDDIAAVVKPILAKNDLVATYSSEFSVNPPKTVFVMTLMHKGGHSEQFRSVPLPMVDSGGGKNDIQGAGSVSSYGRRYVVGPAFDLVAEGEDDDGSGRGQAQCITEEQAQTIRDIVEACNERDPKFATNFGKWLRAEFQVETPAHLFEGAQHKAVRDKLLEKQRILGLL